jgi:hypothetical protein
MSSERFTFSGEGADQISPEELRNSLARELKWPRVDVSHDGKRFDFWEYGLVVFLKTDEAGNAVGAIADFSCVDEGQHVISMYKAFQKLGWTVEDNERHV